MLSEMRRLWAGCKRAVHEPFQELNRWQRAARFAYDLGRYGARQLKHDRAPQMAAALAFRTLFGLAPILVVTTILIKTIKGPQAIIETVRSLLIGAGLDRLQVGAVPGMDDDAAVAPITLAQWLEDLTGQLVNADMSAAGLVGFVVIIYAAIGLMVTIENSFNMIYRAPDGRPWSRRVPLYWFILTISPIVIGLTSYMNGMFSKWMASVETWQVMLIAMKYGWAFAIAWLSIIAIYTLIPNAHVRPQPVVAGALVATTLLSIGKHTLGAYLGNAFAINQLYGSLGLVPLFMFWVYLMWLALLFGLEVSATLQRLQGRTLEEMDPPVEHSGLVDPTSVLALVEVIAEHFVRGKPVTAAKLAEVTTLPPATVKNMVDRLVQDGWLHRIEHPQAAITLARPLEQMKANAFLQLGYEMVDHREQGRASALVQQLRDAQRKAADGITMAMLVSVPQSA